MKILSQYILIFAYVTNSIICSQAANQSLVNYYAEYINNYFTKALNYKPPKDAREYKPLNTTPKGK